MFSFRLRARGAWVLIAGMVLSGASAQSPDSATGLAEQRADALTLGDAIAQALAANPALRGFGFRLQAGDARVQQASQRPATVASLELENVLGSGDTRGFDAAETTFALSRVVELGDKRGSRTAAAEAGLELVSIERQAAQLDVVAEVARRFVQVAALQEYRQLAADATGQVRSTVTDVERRVAAARSPEAELLRARAALATAEIDERRASQQLLIGRRLLAATWNAAADTFSPIRADLYRFSEPDAFESLATRLEGNPDFLRFTSEARLRDAELQLARSARRPDIEFSAGLRRLEGPNDHAFVLGVAVPLFAGKRSAPALAESNALRGLVGAEREAALLNARSRLFELHQELVLAIAETRALDSDVLPRLQEALKRTRYAYERGRYSYLELVDAQQAWRDARRTLIDAALRGHSLRVEIERLTGESIEASATELTDGSSE